jgi:epoxyqueuosine reductase
VNATLLDRLKGRAAELHLGSLGVAPITPSDHADALRRWLDRGFAAGMTWMHRTSRDSVDLGRRFAWARSALVVAQPYLPYHGDRHAQAGLLPHVSRYAAGRDYHATLGERLERLAAFVREEAPGTRTRVYVDTGPVLERELAARAGLGFFGKNANLIGPRGDSWILLGQILTSLEAEAETPAADRCGTCTACLEACPTQAITEPYVVDSDRCISYLTIEVRGRIAPERHADLGDWIFGCDICQEVCPWNRKIAPVEDAPFRPGRHLEEGSLADLLRSDPPDHESRFAGTALTRPRRQGLLRNALIVAANTGDAAALDAAAGRLQDADPVVRSTAALSLSRAGGATARRRVDQARRSEDDPQVRQDMERALG